MIFLFNIMILFTIEWELYIKINNTCVNKRFFQPSMWNFSKDKQHRVQYTYQMTQLIASLSTKLSFNWYLTSLIRGALLKEMENESIWENIQLFLWKIIIILFSYAFHIMNYLHKYWSNLKKCRILKDYKRVERRFC